MNILQAKTDFGPVKKGDKLIVLPEHHKFVSSYVGLPFFTIPRLFIIELVGVLLNQDLNRADCTNSAFNSGKIDGDDSYILLVDTRLLAGAGKLQS